MDPFDEFINPDAYEDTTTPNFTFGGINSRSSSKETHISTDSPVQVPLDTVSALKSQSEPETRPPPMEEPEQEGASSTALTKFETRSPRNIVDVPTLAEFEASFIGYVTLQAVSDWFNINLQIHRYRALLNLTDEPWHPEQKGKVGQQQDQFFQEIISLGGETVTSLHEVREAASARVRQLQEVLRPVPWGWGIRGWAEDVGEIVLDYLVGETRNFTKESANKSNRIGFITSKRRMIEYLKYGPWKPAKETNRWAVNNEKLEEWFGKDKVERLLQVRRVVKQNETTASSIELERDRNTSMEGVEQANDTEEAERARDFTIMVNNAVEIWKLPLAWPEL